jgi:glutathione S-transferase
MRIVERLEALAPEQPLYPREPDARARVDVFVDWFNEVWKRAPNGIWLERERGSADPEREAARFARMAGWLARFEQLLTGGDYLLGDGLGAADVCAFPFLKYALLRDPTDDEPYHLILEQGLRLGDGFPRLRAWIERVDALPRA